MQKSALVAVLEAAAAPEAEAAPHPVRKSWGPEKADREDDGGIGARGIGSVGSRGRRTSRRLFRRASDETQDDGQDDPTYGDRKKRKQKKTDRATTKKAKKDTVSPANNDETTKMDTVSPANDLIKKPCVEVLRNGDAKRKPEGYLMDAADSYIIGVTSGGIENPHEIIMKLKGLINEGEIDTKTDAKEWLREQKAAGK